MNNSTTYLAMDTQKNQHKLAVHFPQQIKILEFTVRYSTSDVRKIVNKITKHTPADVSFGYEACFCRFNPKRRIEKSGRRCAVITHQPFGGLDTFHWGL